MKRESLALAVICLMFGFFSLSTQAQVSFFQPPTYAGSGSVFVADFNGDGKPDILTSDGTMNLGNGDGTFTLGTSVSVSSGQVLAVADFNGDGKADVLEQGTGTLLVLSGNGDGTFQTAISTVSGASLSVVSAADLNGDGKADVVGLFGSSLLVYISKGDGTFAAGVSYNIGFTSFGFSPVLSLGDFNGDQKTDVVVSLAIISGAGQEITFLGNGDGTFQTTPKTSTGVVNPGFSAIGDFNGDGRLDLALSQAINGCTGDCNGSVLLGNGDGTFQAPAVVFSNSEGVSFGALAAADMNGDGKLDLVVNQIGAQVAQVYLGDGDGTFSITNDYIASMAINTGGPPANQLAVGDFNGDKKVDVASLNSVLLGNGDGTFQGIPIGSIASVALASVAGDFEKDGTPDIAVEGFAGTALSLTILHNNGAGVLSPLHSYALPYALENYNSAIVTADFNGDGNLDLIVFAMVPNSSEWAYIELLGNGDGSFQSPVSYTESDAGSLAFGGSSSFVVADFNNDKKPDIAFTFQGYAASSSDSLGILLGNGDGTFAAPVFYYDDGFMPLMLADFNGDGKLDLATSGVDSSTNTRQSAILFGNGDGTFQAAVFPTSLSGFQAQFSADLNNDGKADLISGALTPSTITNQVALSNGDGSFTLLPALAYQVSAVADFNGDGKIDVVATQNTISSIGVPVPQQTGVLLGNGDGTFGSFINIVNNGVLPLDIQIADMNHDGTPDIVFPWFPGIGVLLNTATAVAQDFAITAASGSTSSQTISAGQTASFNLVVVPMGSFTGTVNLSCAVTPASATAPTCSLSTSSLQIGSSGAQPVIVKVSTTSATAAVEFSHSLPPGTMPLTWSLLLLGSAWLCGRNRRRLLVLGAPVILLALAFCASCGGGSSSSSQGTKYDVTVTATAGSVSQNMALTVVVQ